MRSLLSHLALLGACLLIASMLLAACGGDDSDDSAGESPTATGESAAAVNTATTAPSTATSAATDEEDETSTATEAEATEAESTQSEPSETESQEASGGDYGGAYGAAPPASTTETEAATSAVTASESSATEPSDSAEKVTVTIHDFKFDPPMVEIAPGTTVVFVNQGVDHTATSVDDPPAFDSDILKKGDSFEFTFNDPGTFDYICLIHPKMKGTIVVK